MWLDTPDQWEKLAALLVKKGEAGIDSETYNQPNRTSPQHRTKISHWSIAVLSDTLHSRGYNIAKGVALPPVAFENARLRAALQQIQLYAHNAPHDHHSFANEGLVLDIQDTLQWTRVAVPGKRSYGLKTHISSKGVPSIGVEEWALGKPRRPDFKQLVSHEEDVVVVKTSTTKACICGKQPCRSRSTSEWWDESTGWFKKHERVESVVETRTVKKVKATWEVTDFNPEHPRWKEWLDYVIVDAVSGIELVSWLRNVKPPNNPYPWRGVSK